MILELKTNKASAKIDSIGAQLISLRDTKGTEYIWQRNPDVWKNCSPILFPIIGNCRENKTFIEGSLYEIPKHGPCKTTSFHLADQTDSSASFVITHEDFPEGCYPYHFRLLVSYQLQEQVLTMTLTVQNLDSREIFYCIGLHPGITCPLYEGETFEDYVIRFSEKQPFGYRHYDLEHLQFDMTQEYPFPGDGISIPLKHSLFSQDALWFDRITSREVSILNPSTGQGIHTRFPDFETVAFWTATTEDAHYVCIEPWNGSAVCSDEDDDFKNKNHIQQLEKDASKSYSMIFEIL